MPMGFGAERANLMGEAAVEMPVDNSAAAGGYSSASTGESENAAGS